MEKIAKGLGAERRGQLVRATSDHFGAAQLAAEVLYPTRRLHVLESRLPSTGFPTTNL